MMQLRRRDEPSLLRKVTCSAVRNTPDFHDTAAQAKLHHWKVMKRTAKQTEFEENGN
jgi:hypothetical protein